MGFYILSFLVRGLGFGGFRFVGYDEHGAGGFFFSWGGLSGGLGFGGSFGFRRFEVFDELFLEIFGGDLVQRAGGDLGVGDIKVLSLSQNIFALDA